MRILLLGSGGREHALAWKLNQSVWANPLYIAPGNPGTAQCGKNVSIDIKDFDAIKKFCLDEKIEIRSTKTPLGDLAAAQCVCKSERVFACEG